VKVNLKIPVYIDSPMAISDHAVRKIEKEHKLENKEVFNCPQFQLEQYRSGSIKRDPK
jgi:hypothetical protein